MTRPSDEWVDAYIDSHPDSCIEDAERAWWDQQVDAENPEVGKLNAEQEKVARDLMRGKAVDAYGKTRKRERKPDLPKRELIATIADALALRAVGPNGERVTNLTVVNAEQEIALQFCSGDYSVKVTKHRPPKG